MTFDHIYRDNRWAGVESLSGPGSGDVPTARLREALPALCRELGVRAVLDVGCGDGYWMPDLPGYQGTDVSSEALKLARSRNPGRDYARRDYREAGVLMAPYDLVIIRDVLQHLSFASGLAILEKVRRSGSTWLLASTYIGGSNVDLGYDGEDAYSPDLTAPPFDWPVPDRYLVDGYAYHRGGGIRDPQKMLGLWRV